MLGPNGEERNRPTAGTGASRKKANIAPAGNQEAEADISKEGPRREAEAMGTGEGNASEKGATVIMTTDGVLSGIKRRLAKRSRRRKRIDGREAKKKKLRKTNNWIRTPPGDFHSETLAY